MALAYEDLKTATFLNNLSFVSEWLQTCAVEKENKDENQKWMGSLLGLAAYHHSVDVVLCIIDHIRSLDDCKGEPFSAILYVCSRTLATHNITKDISRQNTCR